MMRRASPSTVSFLALALAASAAACAKDEARSADGWTCASAEVPMGDVVRCTQNALLIDPGVEPAGAGESCSGTADNPDACTTYTCTEGEPGCPSSTDTGSLPTGGAGTDGTTTGGSGAPNEGSGGAETGGSAPSPPGKSGGKGNGKNRDFGGSGDGSGTPGSGGASGGSGGAGGCPRECSYVDGLPYCDGAQEAAPAKKAKKKNFECTKSKDGRATCESETTCAPGTRPSACGACVPEGESQDCVPPKDGGCWVTGGGFIVGPNETTGAAADGHDNFGGNAKPMRDGRIQGHWNHVDHGTKSHAKGKPAYIVCRHVDEPGPGQPGAKKGFTMNQVYFGGPAEWSVGGGPAASGYWFDVVAKDHGEPGSVPKDKKNGGMVDTYHFTIRKVDDPARKVSGAVVYETRGGLEGGNIQLHPPNAGHPYTPSALPGWVSFEP